jgi:hypothetical protein
MVGPREAAPTDPAGLTALFPTPPVSKPGGVSMSTIGA